MVDVDSFHASLDAIESFFELLPGENKFPAFHLILCYQVFFSHGALPSGLIFGNPEGSLQPQSFNCGSRKPSELESAGISGEVNFTSPSMSITEAAQKRIHGRSSRHAP